MTTPKTFEKQNEFVNECTRLGRVFSNKGVTTATFVPSNGTSVTIRYSSGEKSALDDKMRKLEIDNKVMAEEIRLLKEQHKLDDEKRRLEAQRQQQQKDN